MPRPEQRPEDRRADPRSGRASRAPRVRRTRDREAPSAPPEPAPGRVAVARIRRPWGTDGSLAVTPFGSDPERLSPGSLVFVGGRPTTVVSAHTAGSALVVRVDSVRSASAAELLRDGLVEVAAEDLPPLPSGTYYHYQLADARVCSIDGVDIGTVTSVLETGSNDVYIVRPPDGGKPILIPAIADVVKRIDIEAGLITVDLPEGLI